MRQMLYTIGAWEYSPGVYTTYRTVRTGLRRVWVSFHKQRAHVTIVDPDGFKHCYRPKLAALFDLLSREGFKSRIVATMNARSDHE